MTSGIRSGLTSIGQLNYVHRMTARILCILLWAHAGGRVSAPSHLAYDTDFNNPAYPWVCFFVSQATITPDNPYHSIVSWSGDHLWYRAGPVALGTFTLFCILSIGPLRDRHFEVFKFLHIGSIM